MNIIKSMLVSSIIFASLGTSVMAADAVSDDIRAVQHNWAELNYSKGAKSAVVEQLEALVEKTEILYINQPRNADVIIWSAIVLSTLANKKGGLGALSLVKRAKQRFEDAVKIDSSALNGSAYASLGTLYHKVPGWPVGFGNSKKARENFQKALTINPTGLDINFFYADFLADNNEKTSAIKHLKLALAAPTLNQRPTADTGRRAEVKALLSKLTE